MPKVVDVSDVLEQGLDEALLRVEVGRFSVQSVQLNNGKFGIALTPTWARVMPKSKASVFFSSALLRYFFSFRDFFWCARVRVSQSLRFSRSPKCFRSTNCPLSRCSRPSDFCVLLNDMTACKKTEG